MKKLGMFLGLLVVTVTAITLFNTTKTYASNGGVDEIPSKTINGGNWDNIYLELSKPNPPNNTLDAPEVYAKLTYDKIGTNGDPSGKHRFRIYDFGMCDNSSSDYGTATGDAAGDCYNGGANVIYAKVCTMDANENITTNCTDINSCPFGCWAANSWTNYFDINLGGGIRSNINGKYNYAIKFNFSWIPGPPAGNINSFRVEASWGKAGFMSRGTYPIAVQNRNKSQNYLGTPWEDSMDFHYKIPCSYVSNSFTLHWFDSDSNTFDPNIAWTVTNVRTGQQFSSETAAFLSNMKNAQYMGGDGVDSYGTITDSGLFGFVPGDEIIWTWRNVQANNGVTMYMPFDDARNASSNCVNGSLDAGGGADCADLVGWGVDLDVPDQKLDYHVYYDGPPGVGTGIAYTAKAGAPVTTEAGVPIPPPHNGPTVDPVTEPGKYQWMERGDVRSAYLPGIDIGNQHGFKISIPAAYKDGKKHTIYVYVIGIGYLGNTDGSNKLLSPISTTIKCPEVDPPTCDNTLTTAPVTKETGVEFDATFGAASDSPVDGTGSYEISDASGTNVSGNVSYTGLTTTVSGIIIDNPDDYTFKWKYTASGVTVDCSSDISVYNKPYLQVSLGDVSTDNDAEAFNKDSTGNYDGAGGQLGVFAGGSVTEFASALFRTAVPMAPKALTFANTGAATYGGAYGTVGVKPFSEYWNAKPAADITSGDSVTKVISGDYKPTTGQTVTAGQKYNIYVGGNAFLKNNIVYDGAGWTIGKIPYFRLIVYGDIYIEGNGKVTNLDGIYIAKGNIYTCLAGNSDASANKGYMKNKCDDQLTINGAFMAQSVKFLRMFGTLKNSNTDSISSSNAAERFVGGPESWLQSPDTSSGHYDAFTTLPPIL